MKKRIICFIMTTALLATTLTGCGEDDAAPKNTEAKAEYAQGLEDGKFYIRSNKDQSCKEVYFGNATFDIGETSDRPSNDRVMWYREDFDKIPTLTAGDSLIMYTQEEYDETFNLERFCDFGYSVGIRGLKQMKSGRYKVSTDEEDKCTYPGGDTDVLLDYANSNIVIESIGETDKEANTSEIKIRNEDTSNIESDFVTRIGTLKGLTKDEYYVMNIYEGTVYHKEKFRADVHVFGSMEVTDTTDYAFEKNSNVINIQIPDFFNTGYYCINGQGLFRYIASGEYYSDSTQFNIENIVPEKSPNTKTTQLDDKYKQQNAEDITAQEKEQYDEGIEDIFYTDINITEEGPTTVTVEFALEAGYTVVDGLNDPIGIIEFPDGRDLKLQMNENDEMYSSFYADKTGTYRITFYNLGVRIPIVSVESND